MTASLPRQDTHRRISPGAGAASDDPVARSGAALMYQAAVLLGPQLGASTMNPHSSSARLISTAPEVTEQLVAQSPEMRLKTTPVDQMELQQQQQQQQQQRTGSEAVRNANAAWTAATWRLISGQQPQP